jgi:hypothetical protein
VVARFLEGVFLPTLPPDRSDTSISFFLRGVKGFSPFTLRVAGGKRHRRGDKSAKYGGGDKGRKAINSGGLRGTKSPSSKKQFPFPLSRGRG